MNKFKTILTGGSLLIGLLLFLVVNLYRKAGGDES